MLLFNPLTGVSHLGLFNAPQQDEQPNVDLLETQSAFLYYSCDCGAHSKHEGIVSIRLDDPEAPLPLASTGAPVVCPACEKPGRLFYPQVLHDPKLEKIVLRLPSTDRSRAIGLLGVWYLSLQASGRAEFPPYILQPSLEFYEVEEETQTTSDEIVSVHHMDMTELLEPPAPRQPGQVTLSLRRSSSQLDSVVEEIPDFEVEEVESTEVVSVTELGAAQPDITQDLTPPLEEEYSELNGENTEDFKTIPAESDALPLEEEPGSVFPFPRRGTNPSIAVTEVAFAPPPASTNTRLTQPIAPGVGYTDLSYDDDSILLEDLGGVSSEDMEAVEEITAEVPQETDSIVKAALGFESIEDALVVPDEALPDLEEIHLEETPEPAILVDSGSQDQLVSLEDEMDGSQEHVIPMQVALEDEHGDSVEELEDTSEVLEEISEELEVLVASVESTSEQLETVESLSEDTFDTPVVEDLPVETTEVVEPANIDIYPTLEASPESGVATLVEPSPRRPTAIPPADVRVATNVDLEAPDSMSFLRRELGGGLYLLPVLEEPTPLQKFARKWHKQQTEFSFGYAPRLEQCILNLHVDESLLSLLDEGGNIRCYLQLHRMPTYPLLTILTLFDNEEGEQVHQIVANLDIDEPMVLMFLDPLMQEFTLRIQLSTDRTTFVRELDYLWPLEQNIEYALNEARTWKEQLETVDFVQGCRDLLDPDYDLVGRMNHNFQEETFADLALPSQTKLAIGIVGYWSEPAQEMYLIERKSFPMVYFHEIQKRVLKTAISMGLMLPNHLLKKALDFGLASSQEELISLMLNNFAELNLQIQHTNDLDPWDNLENWQKLFEVCEILGVEVNENIEEIAEIAQRRCHDEQEIKVESVEDFEIIEDFYEMGHTDLIDLLVEPEYRLESALALCEKQDPEMLPRISSVYQDLELDELEPYLEGFLQFGETIEMYLLQWGETATKEHRGYALRALGTIRSENSLPFLVQSLQSRDVWEYAAEGLALFGDSAIPYLSREFQNPNWIVRLRIVKTLGRIGSETALSFVQEALEDPHDMVCKEAQTILQEQL